MTPELPDYRFCPMCGSAVDRIHHKGRERHVCPACGFVIYVNPLPAATLVVLDDHNVLLTLRAVEPRKGEWCLPGGFLEWGETPEEGAKRELFEETGLIGERLMYIGVYNSMVTFHALLHGYRVESWSGELTCGDDAEAVQWFPLDSLPSLAFDAHETLLADAVRLGEKR